MKLKFDFISDLHMDFYIRNWNPNNPDKNHRSMENFIANILPKHDEISDTLIVAGDMANNNDITVKFFEIMSGLYKQIFYLLGNHEFYVHLQKPQTSLDRVNDLTSRIDEISNVTWLNGGMTWLNGFWIGGTHMWYDGSYAKNEHGLNEDQIYALWRKTMNDDPMITFDVFKSGVIEEERTKLHRIYSKCDLIVTHVPPIVSPFLPVEWQDPTTGFFTFDGDEFIDETRGDPVKAWVYGHTHKSSYFRYQGIDMLCNPMGYPGECGNVKICSWEIEK